MPSIQSILVTDKEIEMLIKAVRHFYHVERSTVFNHPVTLLLGKLNTAATELENKADIFAGRPRC